MCGILGREAITDKEISFCLLLASHGSIHYVLCFIDNGIL